MKGFQITFFTHQDHHHRGKPVAEWLMLLCKSLGIGGATTVVGAEGYGHSGRFHSHHFFELADQPVEVTVAAGKEDTERLFQRLREEPIKLFYIKSEVEFGTLGGGESSDTGTTENTEGTE